MNLIDLFRKKEISKDEKLYQRHQNWIFWLTGFWLLATFEHNYYTLSKYSLDKVWDIFGTMVPISDIANILLVAALELTLFWSITFIPTGKRWGIKMTFIYVIQAVSTLISVVLNIKYMYMARPSDLLMDILIGAVVGGLIPVFVILFGYVEGHVFDSRVDTAVFKTNGAKVTAGMIEDALARDGSLSQRKLAKMFNVSPATIHTKMGEIRKKRMGVN
jgi:hypothetical protein